MKREKNRKEKRSNWKRRINTIISIKKHIYSLMFIMGQALGSFMNIHNVDTQQSPQRLISLHGGAGNDLRTSDLHSIIPSTPNVNIQKISVVRNSINLRRRSLGLIYDGNDTYLINFIFDSLYEAEVTISFCCIEEISDTQPIKYKKTKYETFQRVFPPNVNITYLSEPNEGINLKHMDVNDLKWKPSYENMVPILITLKTLGTEIPQVQFTLAYLQENKVKEGCENSAKERYKIVIYRQRIQFGDRVLEMKEIYGIERLKKNEVDPVNNFLSGRECVICLSAERNTVVLPCRHMCLCNMCTNIVRLHNTKCPICRRTVIGFLQMSFEDREKLDQLQVTL